MSQLGSVSSSPHRRVLIVDDMPLVRQELRSFLQVTGEIEVVGEAANGLEAIQQAEILHPDVVLMDLEMPIMDGYEATRLIKESHLAEMVIILSIHSNNEAIQLARKFGADEYLQKGADFETLMRAILS
jgi:DNA-binding NarL/FixJ family response regulator